MGSELDGAGFRSKEFGWRVRQLRQGKGLGLGEVSAAVGLSGFGSIHAMEAGKKRRLPGPLRLGLLAAALGTTQRDLIEAAGYEV